ncbi:MAG: hypothetical protein WBW16_03460 [Bacteroidota bacterium]
MKNAIPRFLTLCGAALVFVLIMGISAAVSQINAGGSTMNNRWAHLKYALYFTSRDIDSLLADPDQFKKTMEYFAPVKAVHVYLEGSGRGEVNVPLLKTIADKFRAMGIEVSGSMVPVGQRGPSVYNNPDDMASLEKRMRALAQVFDDIILDDWLFTTATDPKSVEERGNQSWANYRTKLILEQSKKYIIGPAKEVNPKVKVIIKYPNWYEGHRDNGYDVYYEDLLFDKMAVGIETRNRMVHDQHIPIYSGYIFQKWWSSVDTKKWVGSWLDNYDMKGDSNDYNAQVWQAVLAQTPEIILWCAGQLYPTNPSSDVYPSFVTMLPDFDKVAGLLKGEPRGVPIYLPYGSTGEYNIFGYLGMVGIPLTPVATFPAESQNAIFTLHSYSDGSLGRDTLLAQKMLDRLRNGKDVFMTWGLWRRLRNTEFKSTLGLVPGGEGSVTSDQFRVRLGWFNQQLIKADRPFTFPRIETTTWPYVRDVAVERDDYDYGVLLNVPYLKGTIYILNMPDNSYDLLRLPPQALNLIRRAFVRELGVELDGPGGVGMYLFGEKQYVLYNMSDAAASLSLKFVQKVSTSGWRELVSGKSLPVNQDTSFVRFRGPVISDVSLELKPFEIAVVQAP